MPDRPSGCDSLGGAQDRLRVDAVMAIEVRKRAGLTERIHAEGPHAMPGDRAQPTQRGRVRIGDGDERAIAGHGSQQAFDGAKRIGLPRFARLAGVRPIGMQPIGRSDGEQAHVTPILGQQPDRFDRLGRHGAGIGDHHACGGARRAQPIAAFDDFGRVGRVDLTGWLFQGARG